MSAFSYPEPDNIVFMAQFIKKVYRKKQTVLNRQTKKEDAQSRNLQQQEL